MSHPILDVLSIAMLSDSRDSLKAALGEEDYRKMVSPMMSTFDEIESLMQVRAPKHTSLDVVRWVAQRMVEKRRDVVDITAAMAAGLEWIEARGKATRDVEVTVHGAPRCSVCYNDKLGINTGWSDAPAGAACPRCRPPYEVIKQ